MIKTCKTRKEVDKANMRDHTQAHPEDVTSPTVETIGITTTAKRTVSNTSTKPSMKDIIIADNGEGVTKEP